MARESEAGGRNGNREINDEVTTTIWRKEGSGSEPGRKAVKMSIGKFWTLL